MYAFVVFSVVDDVSVLFVCIVGNQLTILLINMIYLCIKEVECICLVVVGNLILLY